MVATCRRVGDRAAMPSCNAYSLKREEKLMRYRAVSTPGSAARCASQDAAATSS